MARIPLTLVVACSPSNGIGKDGGLPWRLKREMAYFRHTTSRCPAGGKNAVLMGRNTWLSIPPKFRPLAGRINIVLSHKQNGEELGVTGDDAHHCRTLDEASRLLHDKKPHRVFLIGGAELYSSFLRSPEQGGFVLERLLVTRLATEFDCDTCLPLSLPGSTLGTSEAGRAWRQATPTELLEWVPSGTDLPPGLRAILLSGPEGLKQEEDGVRYEMQMWT